MEFSNFDLLSKYHISSK